MTFTAQKAPVLAGANAAAGAGSILAADALDVAVANLTTIVDYVRAKNCANPAAAWKTRAGNILTPGNATAALIAADANYGGLNSINIAGMTAPATPFTDNIAVPSSFTVAMSLRPVGVPPQTWYLFSSAYSSSGPSGEAQVAMGTTGTIYSASMGSGDTAWGNTTVLTPHDTTCVVWISHNAATKVTSFGTNAAVAATHTDVVAHAGNAATYLLPFSAWGGAVGYNLHGTFEGILLTSKAYQADGSTEDTNFAKALTAWRALIGASN
jgi:hypothetical protein